jgi:hypothetical protein
MDEELVDVLDPRLIDSETSRVGCIAAAGSTLSSRLWSAI